jgi:hypothetical protein
VPGTERVTRPVQTCGVRPLVLTDTTTWFSVSGDGEKVLPLAEAADKKPGQLDVLVATAKISGAPVLPIVMVCGDGVVFPV